MSNVILSKSEKKEAAITYSISNKYIVRISQIVNTGIGVEKDLVQTKWGFASYEKAAKWALKQIN